MATLHKLMTHQHNLNIPVGEVGHAGTGPGHYAGDVVNGEPQEPGVDRAHEFNIERMRKHSKGL